MIALYSNAFILYNRSRHNPAKKMLYILKNPKGLTIIKNRYPKITFNPVNLFFVYSTLEVKSITSNEIFNSESFSLTVLNL